METKQTAVEWLAAKYNHITWMRNRDEISAGMADEWRKHYLEQAKQMEKKQIMDSFIYGVEIPDIEYKDGAILLITPHNPELDAEQYYNETYESSN